jgi:hypothetical protein
LLIFGSSLPIALAIYGLMAVTLMVFRFFVGRAQRATRFKLGRWSEERIVEALRIALDGRWTLIRNFTWPGRKDGDIDLVLVGPSGVWAFEVKAYSGAVRNIGDTWERKSKRGWRHLEVHPGVQARTNAADLKAFLNTQGIPVSWVQAVVIWAGGETTHPDDHATLILDQPKTSVWQSAEIADRVNDLWQNRRTLDDQTMSAIVDLLRRTVQQAAPCEPAQGSRSAVSTNYTP